MQRTMVTTVTTPQASRTGAAACRPIMAKNCAGGCPAGIYQGSSGATPAASENVSNLRVNQPLTFGRASFHTKEYQASRPLAKGPQPYRAAFWSNQYHLRHKACPCLAIASRGNKN